MATNFDNNALSSSGGFKPSTKDTPIDIRSRVATETDILEIPNPYVGMIVYVQDTGKRFEVLSIKDVQSGLSKVSRVNEYKEFMVGGTDGLTTSIKVNGSTFVQQNGVITLPDYPEVVDSYTRDDVDDIVYDYTGGKKQRYISQVEYDNLTQDELNDDTIVWNITDGEEVQIPVDLTIDSSNLLQLKDSNGNTIGTGVRVSTSTGESAYTLPTASSTELGGIKVGERLSIDSDGVLSADIQQDIISNDLILISPSGYQFKLVVSDEGQLSTEAISVYGDIIASVSELTINEGESATFTISLSETPTEAQTISIVSDNTDVTVNPSSIDISDTNPHTITVSVSEDEDNDVETATLTLSSANVSNVTVNVLINEHCTGISLDQTSLALTVRGSQQLTATVTPEGCTDEIVWSTSNENCTVENGLVRAINEGDCVITATCGNYSATCNITVNALPAGANLFNASYVADGMKYDEETTEISNVARWAYFAYIPIEGGKKYKVSFSTNTRIISNTVGSDKSTNYDAICDTSSLVDGNTWFDVTSDVITTHVDASYIRMQLANDANYKAFIKDIFVIEVE